MASIAALMRRSITSTHRLFGSGYALVVVVLSGALSGCGSIPEMVASTPISSSGYTSSIGSSIGSSSFASDSFSAPQRSEQRGELVVRPDAITMVFAVKDTQSDPAKATASLEKFAASILARFQEATGGAASMKMCGASVSPVASGSSKADTGERVEYAVLADGSIEIKLAPEQDYWARSRLLGAITQAAREIVVPPKKEGDKEKSAEPARPQVHFNEPQVIVKDVEAHRAKLVERWVKRTREFGDAVQAAAAPLYMVDCAPPAPIEQRPISLEEVGLSLPVTCRVDVLRPGAGAK